jgi:hypothetical protein
LKQRLGMALSLNPKGDNSWLQFLQPIVDDYNGRFVRDSKKFRRNEVDKFNVNALLAEKYNVKDFTPIFNTSVLGNFSKEMLEAIPFKFQVGQKVLVSKSANYKLKSDSFAKRSADGSYGKKPYEVDKVFLKSNSKHMYTMVFKLKNLEGMFYPTELISADFSEDPGAEDEDAAERKKREARAKKRRELQ